MSNGKHKNPVDALLQKEVYSVRDTNLSALRRGLLQQFGSDLAPAPGGITRHGIFANPVAVGLAAPILGTSAFLAEMSGYIGGKHVFPGAEQGELDITDPSVDPKDTQLNGAELFLRSIRRLGRSAGASMQGKYVGPLAPGSGLMLAYESGELAPPRNKDEYIIDFLGSILSGLITFGALGGASAIGVIPKVGSEAAAALPLGLGADVPAAVGKAVLPAKFAERLAATVPGARAGGPLSAIGSLYGTSGEGPITAKALQGLAGNLLFDTGIGAAVGLGEASGEKALGQEDVNTFKMVRDFGLFGLGLGAFFRARTGLNATKAAGRFIRGFDPIKDLPALKKGVLTPEAVAPGVVVGDVKSVLINNRVQYYNTKTGRLTKLSSAEELKAFQRASLEKAESGMREPTAVQAEAAEQVAEQASPQEPSTLPPDLAAPENTDRANLIGALYYVDADVPNYVARHGVEKTRRRLRELRTMLFDPEVPLDYRVSAAGQVVALEEALKESQGTVAGALPFSSELEAALFVRQNIKRLGAEAVKEQASRLAIEGRPAVAERIRTLVDRYAENAGELAERYHKEINSRLDKISRKSGRGFKKDAMALLDGKPIRLAEDPEHGLAYAEPMVGEKKPILVDVEDIIPFPKVGKTVRLKDGTVLRVRASQVDKGQFMVERKTGRGKNATTQREWIPFDQIEEVGSARSIGNQHIEALRLREELADVQEDVEAVPSTPAITDAGESVTVTGVGSEVADVVTKSGRRKRVPRTSLRRSTKNKPESVPLPLTGQASAAATGAKSLQIETRPHEIVDFSAGTLPDPDHKILFFNVDKEKAAGFEDEIQNGALNLAQMKGALSSGKGRKAHSFTVHALPPKPATSGEVLYAMEVPADLLPLKHYTDKAKDALSALDGSATVSRYTSSIDAPDNLLGAARFYRVSDDLHAAAQRPVEALSQMSQEEQTQYLRRLIAMDENVQSELAAPLKKVRKAQESISLRLREHDPDGVLKSQTDLGEANVETAEAVADLQAVTLNELVTKPIAEEAAALDPEAAARAAFDSEGLNERTTDFWYNMMDNLELSPKGDIPAEASFAISEVDPSMVMKIVRRSRPAVRTTSGGDIVPSESFYFELTPIDADGRALEKSVVRAPNAIKVREHLDQHGYKPTLMKYFNAEYRHGANPHVVARVKILPKGGASASITRTEQVLEKAPTSLEQRIAVQLAESTNDAISGAIRYKEIAAPTTFKSSADASAWLKRQGFVRVQRTSLSTTTRFKALPPLSALEAVPSENKQAIQALAKQRRRIEGLKADAETAAKNASSPEEARKASLLIDRANGQLAVINQRLALPAEGSLEEIEKEVGDLVRKTVQEEGAIPEPLKEYAASFAEHYYNRMGRAPWSKAVREYVGTPSVEDLMPSPETHSIFGSIQDGTLNVEDAAEFRQNYSVKVQESPDGLEQAGRRLAQQINSRVDDIAAHNPLLAKAFQQVSEKAQALSKSANDIRKMGAGSVRALRSSVEEMRRLVRTTYGLEKLYSGTKLTPSELSSLPTDVEGLLTHALQEHSVSAPVVIPKYHEIVDDLLTGKVRTVLGAARQEAKNAKAAWRILKANHEQTSWSDVYAKSDDSALPHPNSFDPERINVARYRPTGQVVEIIGGPLDKLIGDEVTIRFLDKGDEMTVSKDLLRRGRSYSEDGYSYKLAHWINSGRYADVLGAQEKPFGFGKLERDLGLYTTDDYALFASKLNEHVKDLMSGIQVNAEGDISSSKEVLDELFETWRRSLWLDAIHGTEKVPLARGFAQTSSNISEQGERLKRQLTGVKVTKATKVSDVVINAIKELDPKLEKPFRRAAYWKTYKELGDHPIAQIQARAYAGLLEPTQENAIRGWMEEIGLKNVPMVRAVEELAKRRLIDPTAARLQIELNKEAGYQLTLGSLLGGTGTLQKDLKIVIRYPHLASTDFFFSKLGGIATLPYKAAAKHPLARLAYDLVERARELELRMTSNRYRAFRRSLQDAGLKYTDRQALRALRFEARDKGWKGWEDMVKNSDLLKGLTPERLQQYQVGHYLYEHFMNERMEDLIRHFLRRGVRPVEFDPKNDVSVMLANRISKYSGVELHELEDKALLFPDFPQLMLDDPSLAEFGMGPSSWGEDQIDTFMQLRREYKLAKDIPEQPPPNVTPELYDEMKEVFDFWQEYGIDNYWPLVHIGNYAVSVDREGGRKVLAWATSWPEARQAVKMLRKRGTLGPEEAVFFDQRKTVHDDIIVQHTKSAGEMKQFTEYMAEQTSADADKINAILVRSDRPDVTYMRRPGQVHGKVRTAELRPLTDDPDREMAIFNARIARAEYRWRVLQAFRTMHDVKLDRALSEAYGTPRLLTKEGGMPNLYQYMKDRFSVAVGEQGIVERITDEFMMALTFMKEAPKEAYSALSGESDIRHVFNRETYFRKYATRARAGDLLKFQSLIRLGFSPGSAIANASQFIITAAPKFIDDNTSMSEAVKLVWDAYKDGAKIWNSWVRQGKRPAGELGIMFDLIDQGGIDLMVTKQMAGAGKSLGDTIHAPLPGGENLAERLGDWADYYGMYLFNGAEKTNRYATAIGAIRKYAASRGTTVAQLTEAQRSEAAEAARQLVRDTQFLYHDLAMPKMFTALGPLGRILFQFKPFMVNMFAYQKDLLVNAIVKRDATSMKQLVAHSGALLAFGGAVGALYSPLISLPAQMANMLGVDFVDPATRVQQWLRQRRMDSASPEENFTNSFHANAEDILYYGLPGLTSLLGLTPPSMGRRVGVAGQEILSTFDAPGLAGPHASIYLDLANAWKEYLLHQRGRGGALAGALVGGVAYNALVPAAVRSNWLAALNGPLASIFGAALMTKGANNPFGEFLANSPEGKRFYNRVMPSLYRNISRTMEVFRGGASLDMDGKPMYIPAGNRAEEMMWNGLGLPSARREEYQSAISFMTSEDTEIKNTRAVLINKIATALLDNNQQAAYDALAEAQDMGITIPRSSIDREIESRRVERIETIKKSLSIQVR